MTDDFLDLWDYRRRVHEIYAAIRASGADEESWNRWREQRSVLLTTHPQSALASGSPVYFDYDPSWRIEATVEPLRGEVRQVRHSGVGSTRFLRFGKVTFDKGDAEVSLFLYWLDDYAGGVFLPFRDATSGRETYGGGRYLLDTAKGADLGFAGGGIVLDFNFSYHPSCVYNARWSCPLAPQGNATAVEIRAGERLVG
jgi:uncharacterized protein (DUF1684 family)